MQPCLTRRAPIGPEAGFSLPELLISVTILLVISSGVTTALLQMTNAQHTISNRTQLHAGVRSATELLQQEVGQAGRVALPGPSTLTGAVAAGLQTVGVKINGVDSVAGIFVGEQLTIGPDSTPCSGSTPGSNQETVTVTAVNAGTNEITATFACDHVAVGGAGAVVTALGGFATGIVPDKKWTGAAWDTYPSGSDGTHLKLYGDINSDGSMKYVEYFCDTVNGKLYRNVMAFDAVAKPALTDSQILLNNITSNPGGTACFTYMPSPLYYVTSVTDAYCGCAQSFVVDVAITLTVNTQNKDRITNQFQTETKALLNVSPRNVFNVWQYANANVFNRVQPMPPSVQLLLP